MAAPASLAEGEAELEQLSPQQRDLVETALMLVLRYLLDEPPAELRKFLASADLEKPARLKNRARLQLLSARVQEESIRGSELRERLGVSRQRLAQLRDSGKLLGIQPPLRSEHWYPDWQFDAAGKVRPIVPVLVEAARAARLTPLSLHLLLTNPDAGVAGSPLVDLLDERPDDVVELIEAGTAQGT
ncbi:MAG TPA: hypothetical protein VF101_09430 [Gaiellaceae bacterium]